MKILLWAVLCAPLLSGGTADSEARAIVGFEQAGASASKPGQNFFFDFFIDRRLHSERWSLWGEVRIASAPQAGAVPVVNFDPLARAGALQLNELAETVEFHSGLDYHPWQWNAGAGVRRMGLVASFGAGGPLDPASRLRLFAAPSPASPQFRAFAEAFPTAAGAAYIGFATPDCPRFQRAWAAGIRLTTFENSSPAATYTTTVGQDEAIGGGHLSGLVWKVDVFYPLPVAVGGARYLYLFGNCGLRLGRAIPLPALVLAPAPVAVKGYGPDVAIVTVPGARDVYRIGLGIDAVALVSSLIGKSTH